MWRNSISIQRYILYRNFGTIYTKGIGITGSLGHENMDDQSAFKRIESLSNRDITKLTLGMGHTSLITSEGSLLTFGRPFDLGGVIRLFRFYQVSSRIAKFIANITFKNNAYGHVFYEPTEIFAIEDNKIISCNSLGSYSIIVTDKGYVCTTGNQTWDIKMNYRNVYDDYLAPSPNLIDPCDPVAIPIKNVILANVGITHSVVATESNEVYCWGLGMNGQLGYGIFDSRTQPVRVEFPRPEKPVGICCGFRHSVVLMESGVFYVWGRSMSNVLKSRKSDDRIFYEDQGVPRKVSLPGKRKAVEICGCTACFAIRADDNTLWVMGLTEYDQNFHIFPVQVCKYNFENEDTKETPVYLPTDARLKQGHFKVAVIYPKNVDYTENVVMKPKHYIVENKEPLNDEIKININPVFEIVFSENKAYLIPSETILFKQDDYLNNVDSYKIVDMKIGWLHQAIIIDKDI